MPRVTVTIPLYNKQDFLGAALESVLAQTYRDLKILVIDDGSTDTSIARVESFLQAKHDIPIELVVNPKNLGVQGNGNRCFDLADTEFIARFDADDIMPPQRIEKQVAYLDAHPEVIQVGGYLQLIGNEQKLSKLPLDARSIKAQMPIFNGISQGTSLFRRSLLQASGERYDQQGPAVGEDWLLFYKLSKKYPMGNIPEVMDIYRIHDDNISTGRGDRYYADIDQVLRFILTDLMGTAPSDKELKLHYWLRGQFRVPVNGENLSLFVQWMERLQAAYTKHSLDLEVLRGFEQRALEQLYFHLDPKDTATLDHKRSNLSVPWRKNIYDANAYENG